MITVKEISNHFKVTPRTVYRWIEEGAPIQKLGSRHYANSIESISEWLKLKGDK